MVRRDGGHCEAPEAHRLVCRQLHELLGERSVREEDTRDDQDGEGALAAVEEGLVEVLHGVVQVTGMEL